MDIQTLTKYLNAFRNLHRNSHKDRGAAPHKPVLLLSLLDEIQRGHITTNFVPITEELVAAFQDNWRLAPPGWRDRMVYPFRYLLQDGFWELVKDGVPLTSKQAGEPFTLNQLREKVDGGRFAPDLWQLIQDPAALNELRNFLLGHYFNLTPAEAQPLLTPDPINYEAEKLKAEAQSKFRSNHTRERKDDNGYFIRHRLFPRVIRDLYNDSCAVCALSVYTSKGSGIVEAAHIMPFGQFHNDDPRNGIAFCKNHHWGFDAGWFTVADDYKIVVSPQLQNALTYITANTFLHLPSEVTYVPDPVALVWHRNTIFLR